MSSSETQVVRMCVYVCVCVRAIWSGNGATNTFNAVKRFGIDEGSRNTVVHNCSNCVCVWFTDCCRIRYERTQNTRACAVCGYYGTGTDISLVASSRMVHESLKAAEQLKAEHDVSAEVRIWEEDDVKIVNHDTMRGRQTRIAWRLYEMLNVNDNDDDDDDDANMKMRWRQSESTTCIDPMIPPRV